MLFTVHDMISQLQNNAELTVLHICCTPIDAFADSDPGCAPQLRTIKAVSCWFCCVQTALKVLGLDMCADTIVGDQLLRGISGGQRKRVTSGMIFPLGVGS